MGDSKTSSVSTGLKPNLGKDLVSGLLVFLIALPLCLGIAMASGFPPVAGIMTAAIGGIVVSFLGSARLTIKGPAAGMIVIVLGAVTELGAGDPVQGYKQALAVGVVAAVLQIALALARTASAGAAMPTSVVHGMLAAIGVIIFSKQSHVALGVKPEAKEPLELLAELPHSIAHANPQIALIGLCSLIVLFAMPPIMKKIGKFQKLPPQLIVLIIAVAFGLYFGLGTNHSYEAFGKSFEVGPNFLVTLPGNLIDAVAFPDFSNILSPVSLKHVMMFTLVGSIESTLSVLAVDTLDPAKKPSDLNKDLLAVGCGNLISSAIGGLPMISEIVRSKANIDAGATSKFSNFFHGLFLFGFVALLPQLLQMIPLAALAAMLVFVGTRLASPSEFKHMSHLGRDQLGVFLTTMVLTLAVDLLVGVAAGLVLTLILNVARGATPRTLVKADVQVDQADDTLNVVVRGAAGFRALGVLRDRAAELPESVRKVRVDLGSATMVSHTFLERLDGIADEWPHAKLELVGLEQLRAASQHPHANRWRDRRAA
ncbi:SulP family inorganic anion transporter [Nannocystaceae bacterium ST9]